MDYLEYYYNNKDFKTYVDKYCIKHQIEHHNALRHILVRCYADQLAKREAEIIPAETKIEIGCGGGC